MTRWSLSICLNTYSAIWEVRPCEHCWSKSKITFLNTFGSLEIAVNEYICVRFFQIRSFSFQCYRVLELNVESYITTSIYLLRFNKRNTRTRCEICSKLALKTPEGRISDHAKIRIIAWKVSKYEDFSGPYFPIFSSFSDSGCHKKCSYLYIFLYSEDNTHLNIHTCSCH